MIYIIMCGGKYKGWNEPKPIQKVNGEPIVARTIRLLQENGISKADIAISSNDSAFLQFGVMVLMHENTYREGEGGRWIDAFYPMDKPVCYLYGDVIYSPEAIRTIVETETDSIEYFASCPPYSEQYIKHWEEPFAFKVYDTKLFRACIEVVKHYGDMGKFHRNPISWELWQVIKGTPLDEVVYNYTVINDYTCDIDEMADIEKIGEYAK